MFGSSIRSVAAMISHFAEQGLRVLNLMTMIIVDDHNNIGLYTEEEVCNGFTT